MKQDRSIVRSNTLEKVKCKSFLEGVSLPPALKAAKHQLKKAKKAVRKANKKAAELCKEYLEERAEAEALISGTSKSVILKRIIAAEENRQDYQYLAMLRGKCKSSGLQSLMIPKPGGQFETIHDPKEITEKLIERNKKHFNQAHGTPFTEGPVYELFGWSGTGPAAEDVLAGTLDLNKLDTTEAVKSVLHNLERKEDFEEMSTCISTEDMVAGFKNWDERTSTSPSGRHLTLYKGLLAFEDHVQTDEYEPGSSKESEGE